MKSVIYTLFASLSMFSVADAKEVMNVAVPAASCEALTKDGSRINVAFPIDLAAINCKSRQAVVLTPVVTNGADTLFLPPVALYGRDRWIHYQRDLGDEMLAGKEGVNLKNWQKPDSYSYSATSQWQDWMDGASLSLLRKDYGCCSTLLAEGSSTPIYTLNLEPEEIVFAYSYVRPVADEVKTRSAEGSAYIDFPVNKTVIYPDYRRNTAELGRILATIDSIRNDADITVKSLSIKGYASPEGSYSNNERLAKGRTEALKNYVQNLYHFAPGFIKTSYEPEDWEGLRKWLENNEISEKEKILAIVDGSLAPDPKDAAIKRQFPTEYAYLLKTVYPALRHSDYRIDFEVRNFTDVEEIKRLIKTQPQKLSLNEFYLAAQTYEPGSDDFNEVFETAVRMYPDDEVANLNAANAAISRNDLSSASRYLDKAGDSGESEYVRGLLEIRYGNLEKALPHLQTAARLKVADAPAVIEQVERRMKKK